MTLMGNHKGILLEISRDFMNQSTSDDGAGFNQFNFLTEEGGAPVEPNEFSITNQNGRVLFSSMFYEGFDTYSRWHLVYNDTLFLLGVVNDERAFGLQGFFGPVDFSEGAIPAGLNEAAPDNRNQWVVTSQTPMKTGPYESLFAVFKGRFARKGSLLSTTVSIVCRIGEFDFFNVLQANWNLDTLDGSEGADNPSGIRLLLDDTTAFCIYTPLNGCGYVKLGFIVNEKILFVHQFDDGLADSTSLSRCFTNSPLRIEGNIEAGEKVLRMGLFDFKQGYHLKVSSAFAVGSGPDYEFMQVGCYALGANRNDFYRTFSGGNEFNLRTVGQTFVPLVSLKPKIIFPPGGISAQDNKTVFSIDRITISGASADLTQGIYVAVFFFTGTIATFLTGSNFSSSSSNSSVDIDVTATAITDSIGEKLGSDLVYPDKNNNIKFEIPGSKLNNFMRNYTCTRISSLLTDLTIDPIISVAARTVDAETIDLSAQIVWKEI